MYIYVYIYIYVTRPRNRLRWPPFHYKKNKNPERQLDDRLVPISTSFMVSVWRCRIGNFSYGVFIVFELHGEAVEVVDGETWCLQDRVARVQGTQGTALALMIDLHHGLRRADRAQNTNCSRTCDIDYGVIGIFHWDSDYNNDILQKSTVYIYLKS